MTASGDSGQRFTVRVISYKGEDVYVISDRLCALMRAINKSNTTLTPTDHGVMIEIAEETPTTENDYKHLMSQGRGNLIRWAYVEPRDDQQMSTPYSLSLLLCRELNHIEKYWAAKKFLEQSAIFDVQLPEHWHSVAVNAVLRAADEDWRARDGYYIQSTKSKTPHFRLKTLEGSIDVTKIGHWTQAWMQFLHRVTEIIHKECETIADPLARWRPREGTGRPPGARTFEAEDLKHQVLSAIQTVAQNNNKSPSQVTQNEVAEELDLADDRTLRYHLKVANLNWKELKQQLIS